MNAARDYQGVPDPDESASPGRRGAVPDAALLDLLRHQSDRITQLETIIELAPIGIGIVDLERRTPMTNDSLRASLGYTREEFATLEFSEFTHPDDAAENDRLFDLMARGEVDRFQMEKRFICKDGSLLWGRLIVSLVRDGAGRPEYAIGMVEDITQRKRLEAELRAAETHYRLLVERVPAIVYIAEPGITGRWHYVGPQIEQMLGYTAEEWMSQDDLWFQRVHPDDRDEVLSHEMPGAGETIEGELLSNTYRMVRKDGTTIWVRDDATLLRDPHGGGAFHGVLVDVTEEKKLEERLERQALHDALTGLANRTYFHHLLDETINESGDADGETAVLFVDMDGFKSVNDRHGHALGDKVIVAVAEQLNHSVGSSGVVARLGGDEFGVLLRRVSVADAQAVAHRLLAAISAIHFEVKGERLDLAASIGIALGSRGHTVASMLEHADAAMYRAKQNGRGRCCVAEPREPVVELAEQESGAATQPLG